MGFCAKDEDKIARSLPIVTLASGSLLLFDSNFNRNYKHGIVVDRSVSGERIFCHVPAVRRRTEAQTPITL